jgi:hypothetical protein
MVQHYGLVDQHPIASGAGDLCPDQFRDTPVRPATQPVDHCLVFYAFLGCELSHAAVPLPQSGFNVLPLGRLNEHV